MIGFGDRASGESDYLPKPKIDFKQEIKYNKEEEKQTLSELLRDDVSYF